MIDAPADSSAHRGQWVLHYGEIGTKGQNRDSFEIRLLENVRSALSYAGGKATIRRFHGRFLLETLLDATTVISALNRTPGIVYFAPVTVTSLQLDSIRAEAVRLSRGVVAKNFAVRAKRSNKGFPLNSMELARVVGADIFEATGMKVNLETPEHLVRIEITRQEAIFYTQRFDGVGGLPVGASGTVVALLSGGIDSPVATFKLIRRGCRAVLLHFHNYGRHQAGVREKILALAGILARYQGPTRLYVIPFADLQSAIISCVPAPRRMVTYRRVMLQIGAEIINRENALAFVTGDSVGQVASQTLENLLAIHAASTYPILSPLIGEDKEDIIETARQIDTYPISILPYADCCSYMVADHPDTKVQLASLVEKENKIPLEQLCREALDLAEIHQVEPKPIPSEEPRGERTVPN